MAILLSAMTIALPGESPYDFERERPPVFPHRLAGAAGHPASLTMHRCVGEEYERFHVVTPVVLDWNCGGPPG